jgi:RNA polymerase sigma-70 factor (ECF subfamily)
LKQVEDTLHALLTRALAGDNAAYRQFLGHSGVRLRAYFRRRLSDHPADVEDLVQETLLAIHNSRATWRPAQTVTAWLHAIARYKLIDSLRFRSTRAAIELPLDDEDAEALADAAPTAGEARRDLLSLLATLPDRYRLPIVHVKLEGLSVAETAARTGLSESAVKVGIHRGLRRLARQVRNEP